mgnify:CR=1 FL=1
MMDAQELYKRMKKVQEAKGYFFNKDKERTMELLEALLVNKERYGYMGCPCRLVSGDREADRDSLRKLIDASIRWVSEESCHV